MPGRPGNGPRHAGDQLGYRFVVHWSKDMILRRGPAVTAVMMNRLCRTVIGLVSLKRSQAQGRGLTTVKAGHDLAIATQYMRTFGTCRKGTGGRSEG